MRKIVTQEICDEVRHHHDAKNSDEQVAKWIGFSRSVVSHIRCSYYNVDVYRAKYLKKSGVERLIGTMACTNGVPKRRVPEREGKSELAELVVMGTACVVWIGIMYLAGVGIISLATKYTQ